MTRTRIEWCDFTWNPVIGCRGACPYCYARRMAGRFHLGRSDFLPEWNERNFLRALPKKPSRIFVNSMSDLADWSPTWVQLVNAKMLEHPEHRFLFLSKRPWECDWIPPECAMLGYSATKQDDILRLVNREGCVSFLSLEPLHGPIDIKGWKPPRLRWIIVGAETGNRKGRVIPEKAWLDEIWTFARTHDIPLFFKDSLRSIWPSCLILPQEFPTASEEAKP